MLARAEVVGQDGVVRAGRSQRVLVPTGKPLWGATVDTPFNVAAIGGNQPVEANRCAAEPVDQFGPWFARGNVSRIVACERLLFSLPPWCWQHRIFEVGAAERVFG